MNLFISEKLTGKETPEDGRCMKCDAQFYLVRRILDPLTGETTRMLSASAAAVLGANKLLPAVFNDPAP